LDPDSFEAAQAASNSADAAYNLIWKNSAESADIDEAEMLARKAVHITKELDRYDSQTERCFEALINVLKIKNNYGNETKCLLEDHLNNDIRHHGIDSKYASHTNHHLGHYYEDIAGQSSSRKG
jgi:hypothetical protein